MKLALHKRLLTTASVLTFAACTFLQAQAADLGGMDTMKPAMADPLPGITAVLSVWAGGGSPDSGDTNFEEDFFTFGIDARLSGENFILDIVASSIDDASTGPGAASGSNFLAAAGHWLRRRPNQTFGLFGGLSSTGFQDSDNTAYHLLGGIEGALFREQWTLFAQGGFVDAVSGDTTDTWESGGFIRGGVRFFHTDQSRIEADLMFGFGQFDDSSTGYTAAWGVEYERQLGVGSPYSLFGAYRGHYVEDSTPPDSSARRATDAVFTVGFRAATTASPAQSLRQRDLTGATTFNIPDFHRAFGWPDAL